MSTSYKSLNHFQIVCRQKCPYLYKFPDWLTELDYDYILLADYTVQDIPGGNTFFLEPLCFDSYQNVYADIESVVLKYHVMELCFKLYNSNKLTLREREGEREGWEGRGRERET